MEQRDAFDVVKDLLVARSQGLVPNSMVYEHRREVLAVAARMEQVRRHYPTASPALGLGEDFQDVLKILQGGRGFFGHAALL